MKGKLRKVSERVAEKFDEPSLSVAPLIDVCFLLLIFFMVTSTLAQQERDVNTEVPSPGTPPPNTDPLSVVISVRADGQIVVNPGEWEIVMSVDPDERELPKLVDHLKIVKIGMKGEPPILVRVDEKAEHQRVVDVMNVLQFVGLTKVGFLDEE